jgi:sulfite reductase beta subunit
MVAHTQGWLHCDIPGTDASGAVKALMDELYEEFIKCEMPNRVKLSTSCCEINCGGQADIAIVIQHTKPPKINHDLVANVCERPTVVARCPVAAIRPALVNGKPSLEVDEKKCICCGACFPPARRCRSTTPSIPSWRSGSAARTPTPAASPPSTSWWPRASPTTRRAGPKSASRQEDPAHLQGGWPALGAHGDWIDRIGWPAFFEKTGLPFTKYHIDDWRGGRSNPERFHPYPLLIQRGPGQNGSRPGLIIGDRDIQMKIGIMVK